MMECDNCVGKDSVCLKQVSTFKNELLWLTFCIKSYMQKNLLPTV